MARRSYRSVRRQALHYLARPHAGAPRGPVHSPAAWRRADIDDDSWSYQLSGDDIGELERALGRAPSDLAAIHASTFPLPTLGPRLDAWRATVSQGRGFVRIRGIPVDRWDPADAERCFWALGQHLGRPGAQNGDGELLGHVRDLRLGRDGDVRQYKTSEAIMPHCDAADAVGLLCLHPAREGGLSRIASSVAIFNRIQELRPHLARLLFQPMSFDSRGDGGTDAFLARPASHFRGQLRTFYHAEYLRTATRYPGIPPLSAEQHQLLDLYDQLAGSPDYYLEMELAPGDIQLISNHTIVHSRTAYTDDPARQRHLLRLWLSFDAPASPLERVLRARALAELLTGMVRRALVARRFDRPAGRARRRS